MCEWASCFADAVAAQRLTVPSKHLDLGQAHHTQQALPFLCGLRFCSTAAYWPPVSFFTAWTFAGKDLTGLTVVNVTAGAGQARLLADATEACADTAGNATENAACVADWDSKDERKV
jgi:hypothetical protein